MYNTIISLIDTFIIRIFILSIIIIINNYQYNFHLNNIKKYNEFLFKYYINKINIIFIIIL